MPGGGEEGAGIRHLAHLAQIENDDPVGNVSHQTQIVGDEQVGHLPLPAEPHQHIDDLALNGNVQGRARLLEHHGDMPPQQGRTLLFRHRVQGLSLQEQLPGGDLGGALWQKVHQGFHGGGFAAAGLPHQADLLPPVNVEVNAVQHLGVAPITVVPYTEVFYLHQR